MKFTPFNKVNFREMAFKGTWILKNPFIMCTVRKKLSFAFLDKCVKILKKKVELILRKIFK